MGKIYLKKVPTNNMRTPRCPHCYYKDHSSAMCSQVCNRSFYYVRLTPDELRERGIKEE
jgi:hypothetical protein